MPKPQMKVRYSYLGQQFADPGEIFDDLKALVASGDFTLGKPVAEFERRFAQLIGTKFAINYGGGVKILPAGPVGVNFNIRGYTLPSVGFNIRDSITQQTIKTTNQSVSFFEFGFGVVFKF